MKLHLYTKESAPYSFECSIDIIDDVEFNSLRKHEDINSILNGDDVLELVDDYDWSDLIVAIDSLFDKSSNGVYDWVEKSDEYYRHFDQMLEQLNCVLESQSGDTIETYTCEVPYERGFQDHVFHVPLINFYTGNGDPIGAQLALDMAECFMKANQWNTGFYDSKGVLINDIASWAKNNILDIHSIEPIVWFGHKNDVQECWSITPKTSDLFVEGFWGDYYEGALEDICNASDGLGIYYSVWEYGLEYDQSLFENIKSRCPINLDLANVDRTNELFNLIISIYNDNKRIDCPEIKKDLYRQDVIDCDIHIVSPVFNYSYSKPYRFKPSTLAELNRDSIEEILLEDSAYQESFRFLKDIVIEDCDLSSCHEVWKRVNDVISHVQNQLNDGFICQIKHKGQIIKDMPYSVDFGTHSFLPRSEIINVVFIKSLIQFLNRGSWHIGYKEASQLPKIYNEYAQTIPQDGLYPIVWFNDCEDIIGKLGIWSAQTQYMLSLIWESASSFCSTVFNNIEVHNSFRNTGSPLYKDLEQVFEHVKAQCPIQIHNGKEPVDFEELERVVKRHMMKG